MLGLLKLLIAMSAALCFFVGGMLIFVGAEGTANLLAIIPAHITGDSSLVTGFDNASVDSELRFYGAFMLGAGGGLVYSLMDLERRQYFVLGVAAVFFLGGCARLLSWMAMGPPHALFMGLMVLELIMPLVVFLLWGQVRQKLKQEI